MALIKNISPLRLGLAASGAVGTALVGRAVEMERKYPGKLRLCGVLLPAGEETPAAGVARERGAPVSRAPVTSPEFAATILNEWQPEIIYSAGYDGRFPAKLADSARLGAYNIHPCTAGVWPSYNVANPLQAMLDAHERSGIIALHEAETAGPAAESARETGALIATSKPYAIDAGDDVAALGRKIADHAGWMMEAHMGKYLGVPQAGFLEWGYSELPQRAAG